MKLKYQKLETNQKGTQKPKNRPQVNPKMNKK